MAIKICVHRTWRRRVKSSMLHAISLARYCMAAMSGKAATSHDHLIRWQTRIEQLEHDNSLLREEMRIKDKRMLRLSPHRRPYYASIERMAILELRAGRGWTAAQTAERFQVTEATISNWMHRLDEEGPHALVRTREPVNKFPDYVRYLVRRLKVLCPQLGKEKIAQHLCRAGLQIGTTTVGRFVREEFPPPPPPQPQTAMTGIRSQRPNHIWLTDLTVVPISGGFWTSWLPFAVPQRWPFCWWVAIVLDHFSRKVQGFAVFPKKPTSKILRSFLGRVIRRVGKAPKYLICDKEKQFHCPGFRAWCHSKGIRTRYGAVGKHGSISLIERLILTMKDECTRRIIVSFQRDRFHIELSVFFEWYARHRPHSGLGGRTPHEVYSRQRRRKRVLKCPVVPSVRSYQGRRHLPIVSLHRAV